MGKFPEYPSDEEGGSAVIFDAELAAQYRGEMIGAANSDDSEDDEDGGGAKKDKEKDKKQAQENKKGDADKKGAKEEEEDQHGYKLGRSEFVKGLREADREFHGKHCRLWPYKRYIENEPCSYSLNDELYIITNITRLKCNYLRSSMTKIL